MPTYLGDVVDGGLHAAELRGLDVQQLQHIVGQGVDLVGHAGQGLGGVSLGLLQGLAFVLGLGGGEGGVGGDGGGGPREPESCSRRVKWGSKGPSMHIVNVKALGFGGSCLHIYVYTHFL